MANGGSLAHAGFLQDYYSMANGGSLADARLIQTARFATTTPFPLANTASVALSSGWPWTKSPKQTGPGLPIEILSRLLEESNASYYGLAATPEDLSQ